MDGLSWVLVAALIVAAMFSSVCNYSLRTINRVRLEEELVRRGREHRLEPALLHLGQLVLTAAILRILFNIALILTLAYAQRRWLTDLPALHFLIVGTIAFVLILTFSVTVPSAWAKYAGMPLLARSLGLLQLCRRGLGPALHALHLLDEIVRRLAGAPRILNHEEHIEQQIMSVVTEGEREGVVDAKEKDMIESVLEFQDTRAEQIMTPRTDIVALEVTADLNTTLATIREAGHSRIPVFEENLDKIIGVLYAKDLLTRIKTEPPESLTVRDVMRPPVFVPETKLISDLLTELRRQKVHMAIVLDEFGGTAGLVTIEDLLEEIVGEIEDEHEQPEADPIRRIDEATFELDGRVHVDDLNDELGLALPEDDDYDTVSGLVISTLGHIPARGEKVVRENVTITVLDADPRKIARLRLHIAAAPSEKPAP